MRMILNRLLVLGAIAWAMLVVGHVQARNFGFQALGRMVEGEFHSLTFKSLEGGNLHFESFKNKVVLVTNVASECGYTNSNYKQLRQLKNQFGDDLAIVLVPSNDFGAQEPGTPEEILAFINGVDGADYTVLAKSHVNGPQAHPLIVKLKVVTNTSDKDITWNFETKFFVSPDGKTVSRYSDAFEPIKLAESINFFIRNRAPNSEL